MWGAPRLGLSQLYFHMLLLKPLTKLNVTYRYGSDLTYLVIVYFIETA